MLPSPFLFPVWLASTTNGRRGPQSGLVLTGWRLSWCRRFDQGDARFLNVTTLVTSRSPIVICDD